MFIIDEETGNIECIQGDSGQIVLSGLPTDRDDYVVYFAFIQQNKKPFGSEIAVDCNGASSVTIDVTPEFTDVLSVSSDDEVAEYYYGIKLCTADGKKEETLLIGNNSNPSVFNTVTVYPKRVEGT